MLPRENFELLHAVTAILVLFGHFSGNIFFSCMFILLSPESDQSAIRARLGVASHLSTTPKWGNAAKCLSQRHSK